MIRTKPGPLAAENKGQTKKINCLAALKGGRLASGSGSSATVVIWNLGNGSQLAKLEGHTDGVNCLATLTDTNQKLADMEKKIDVIAGMLQNLLEKK